MGLLFCGSCKLLLNQKDNRYGLIECSEIKKGTFNLDSLNGNVSYKNSYKIVRTKNKQTEYIKNNETICKYDIRWTSPCSYILFNRKLIKGKNTWSVESSADTVFNEIIYVNKNRHKLISIMKRDKLKSEAVFSKE